MSDPPAPLAPPIPPPPSTAGGASALAAAAVAAACLVALLLATLGVLRHEPNALRGDEGSYVGMAASLARDGDLRFTEADGEWAMALAERHSALILGRTGAGIVYSKPVLYPLLVAPLFKLLGESGFLLTNLLLVGVALGLAGAALRRRAGGERTGGLLVLFALASPVAPYLLWKMTESLQVALALAGLALTLGAGLGSAPAAGTRLQRWLDSRWAAPTGALLLGLLVGLRLPNLAVAAIPIGVALVARRWRRAATLITVTALGLLATWALTWTLTGAVDPYKMVRSSFSVETGFPVPDQPQAVARFDVDDLLATSSLGAVPRLEPARSLYALLYFWIGRHSGVAATAPIALVLLFALVRGSDRAGWIAGVGFAGAAAIYLIWWPANYFGGETVVGNRYLLASLPALLFVPRVLPSRRVLLAGWIWTLVIGVSALVSVLRAGEIDRGTQNHAYAGVFRLMPYESTAATIEGRRDRYWSGDFIRFVDPYARVHRWSFELTAGDPAAELEIATSWAGDELAFWVTSKAPKLDLVVSDWSGRHRHRLGAEGGGPLRQEVVLAPASAWRQHRFWWPSFEPYQARTLRLRVESARAAPAAARLLYLGQRRIPHDDFAALPVALDLPTTAIAGTVAEIPIVAQNRGGWTWESEGPLPVAFGARIESLAESAGGGTIEFRSPLRRDVPRGRQVEGTLPITWPDAPGRYRVVVDLVLEEIAWFGDRSGAPLAEAVVTVAPPP